MFSTLSSYSTIISSWRIEAGCENSCSYDYSSPPLTPISTNTQKGIPCTVQPSNWVTRSCRVTNFDSLFYPSWPHLLEVAGEDAINDQKGEEQWPLALNVVKHLQLSWMIVQTASILQRWDVHVHVHTCAVMQEDNLVQKTHWNTMLHM